MNDKNNMLAILNYLTASGVLDASFGAIGIYDEDPRNEWIGSFFDRLYRWTPAYDHEGLYWNAYGEDGLQDYYYRYSYDSVLGHQMLPTNIKTPWSQAK